MVKNYEELTPLEIQLFQLIIDDDDDINLSNIYRFVIRDKSYCIDYYISTLVVQSPNKDKVYLTNKLREKKLKKILK